MQTSISVLMGVWALYWDVLFLWSFYVVKQQISTIFIFKQCYYKRFVAYIVLKFMRFTHLFLEFQRFPFVPFCQIPVKASDIVIL